MKSDIIKGKRSSRYMGNASLECWRKTALLMQEKWIAKEERMKTFRILLVVALGLLLTATGAFAQSTVKLKDAPKPFDGSKRVKVALVRLNLEGEFMQMYEAGAKNRLRPSASNSRSSASSLTTRRRRTSSTKQPTSALMVSSLIMVFRKP